MNVALSIIVRVRVRVRVWGGEVRSHTHTLLTDPKYMSYTRQGLGSGEGITSTCGRVVKQPRSPSKTYQTQQTVSGMSERQPIIWGDIPTLASIL